MISDQIQNILKNSIKESGQATLLVCGGSSPLKIFKELSESDVDWSKVFISLIDDRIVDEDNPDSNVHLLNQHLLIDNVKNASFISLNDDHQKLIGNFEFFDVAIVGMGPDGHFASLFPSMISDTNYLDYESQPEILVTEPVGSPCYRRTSMNLSMILKTNNIFIVIPNEEKMNILKNGYKDKDLPIYYLLNQNIRKINILKTF